MLKKNYFFDSNSITAYRGNSFISKFFNISIAIPPYIGPTLIVLSIECHLIAHHLLENFLTYYVIYKNKINVKLTMHFDDLIKTD